MVSCKQVSCAEDAVQVRRRCYGPASDAEFLRSIADKTPGRGDDAGDHHNQQMRRRQVYLKSYIFVTKDGEAETKTNTGGRALFCRGLPLRRQKIRDDHGSRKTTTSSSSGSGWCAKKAGKALSQLLTRLLLACTCNPASSSSAHAAAADVHRSSMGNL